MLNESTSNGPKYGLAKEDLHLLLLMSAPVIVIGFISNIFILWIWSSVKPGLFHSVYLFKALAVSDLFFLVFFIPARFHLCGNYFCSCFFRILSYGNQTVGIYITLTLALIRFNRLFSKQAYPVHNLCGFTPFRVKIALTLILLCSYALQTFVVFKNLFIPKKYIRFIGPVFKRGLGIQAPALGQIVTMLIVMVKVWHVTKKSASSVLGLSSISTPKQKQTTVSKSSRTKPFSPESAVVSQQNPRPSENIVPGSGTTPAILHNFIEKKDEDLTQRNHSDMISESEQKPYSESDREKVGLPTSESQLEEHTQRTYESEQQTEQIGNFSENQTMQPSSNLTNPNLSEIPESEQNIESSTPQYHCMKPDLCARRIVFIISAMCFTTFVSYVVCGTVKILYYQTDLISASVSYMCNVAALLNSSFNIFFYLCLTSFRAALAEKMLACLGRILTYNVQSTWWNQGDTSEDL